MTPPPPRATLADTLFPAPPLFRYQRHVAAIAAIGDRGGDAEIGDMHPGGRAGEARAHPGGIVDVEIARGDAFIDDQHDVALVRRGMGHRSEEHTSELQSLMRISYAVFCLTKKKE